MKKSLRRHLIKKRKNLSKNFVFENSNKIKERLFSLREFKEASTILFYVSYDNEVNTHQMIKECLDTGKDIIVPISKKDDRTLILSKLEKWDDLKVGSYGILEPEVNKIKEVPLDIVDLIIVPGIGFDDRGNRIGHGKGYYDNLLKKSKSILHIGLAFEAQIEKFIPADRQDIPVNKIITEKRIIECS